MRTTRTIRENGHRLRYWPGKTVDDGRWECLHCHASAAAIHTVAAEPCPGMWAVVDADDAEGAEQEMTT